MTRLYEFDKNVQKQLIEMIVQRVLLMNTNKKIICKHTTTLDFDE